jgi:hypothetical protein
VCRSLRTRCRRDRPGDVDQPAPHLDRLLERDPAERAGGGAELGDRLVDGLVERLAPVLLGVVARLVTLRIVGHGGDELGGRAPVAGLGQQPGARRRLLDHRDRSVLTHRHDGEGHVERRFRERLPLVLGEERLVGHAQAPGRRASEYGEPSA